MIRKYGDETCNLKVARANVAHVTFVSQMDACPRRSTLLTGGGILKKAKKKWETITRKYKNRVFFAEKMCTKILLRVDIYVGIKKYCSGNSGDTRLRKGERC